MSVLIIENAISPAILRACEAAWPDVHWNGWYRYKGPAADKYGSLHYSLIPRACVAALDALADVVVDRIGDSFVDYDCYGAGLHMLPPGGFLGRHLDAEKHPLRPWRRTHSIVLFVNSEWGDSLGGELVIENQVIPVAQGTAVVFTTEGAWHHVNPVSSHSGAYYRKTLALFAWEAADCVGNTSATFKDSV